MASLSTQATGPVLQPDIYHYHLDYFVRRDGTVMPDTAFFSFDVVVDNVGTPTTIGSWRMEMTLGAGGVARRLDCPRLPDALLIRPRSGFHQVRAEDEMFERRVRRLLENDRIMGHLPCLADVGPDLIGQLGGNLCFTVADIRGDEWTTCQEIDVVRTH